MQKKDYTRWHTLKKDLFEVSMKGQKQSVMLTQLRLWDSRRLNSKLGTLPWGQFKKVKAALGDLLKK